MTSNGCPVQEVPTLTLEDTARLMQVMVEDCYITHLQMMENGGRCLAELSRRLLDNDVVDRPITLLSGRRGCGGIGLVAARHLHNWGAWVQVVTTHPAEQHSGLPAFHLAALQSADVATTWADDGWELPPADLVVDALIGTGLIESPQGTTRELILLANSSHAPVLSVDMPTGMAPNTGELTSPHISAGATLSMGIPKRGLGREENQAVYGTLYVADIGIPETAFEKAEVTMPNLFAHDTVVQITI
ncbi:MAG: NAD(P)H-hydrate epimerase [Chloroflexota bacterium]